jgi:hypothetical protein
MLDVVSLLGRELNNRVSSFEKRPGITQILAPFYHDDGDMLEIFAVGNGGSDSAILTDFGMTLMRLSYTFDSLSDGKDDLVQTIIRENGLELDGENIKVTVGKNDLFFGYMAMNRAITQISALKFQKTFRTQSTFIDDVITGILESLAKYSPVKDYIPIPDRDDLVVDLEIPDAKPFFIYAARDDGRYLRSGITCASLARLGVKFRSLVLIEDQENISPKNWKTVTNIVDKQYIGKSQILSSVPEYIQESLAS